MLEKCGLNDSTNNSTISENDSASEHISSHRAAQCSTCNMPVKGHPKPVGEKCQAADRQSDTETVNEDLHELLCRYSIKDTVCTMLVEMGYISMELFALAEPEDLEKATSRAPIAQQRALVACHKTAISNMDRTNPFKAEAAETVENTIKNDTSCLFAGKRDIPNDQAKTENNNEMMDLLKRLVGQNSEEQAPNGRTARKETPLVGAQENDDFFAELASRTRDDILGNQVSEFAQKISVAHEKFAEQIQSIVDIYRQKNQEIICDITEAGLEDKPVTNSNNNEYSPLECNNTLNMAWESLLQETQNDAQTHADTASLIIKNVHHPLMEIATYKKSQSKKLYSFRENFESTLQASEDNLQKCNKSYVEAYQLYKSHVSSHEAGHYMAAYHNAHNEYILQLRASNRQEEEYHQTVLPYLLEELEEIHIDLANNLNGAIESHALLLLTKAHEQCKRFDGILKICKQVNPKADAQNFLGTVCPNPIPYLPKQFKFTPPSDPSIPGSELGTLKNVMVIDKYTEGHLDIRRKSLQKEALELTSYLKQNQDITQTLMNVCQRNLANHLYAKVYETQEDLCRKRNEIRMANLQLNVARSQIELLTPKQNGTLVDADRDFNNKASKSSIRGMWKKAFKSLKSKDKEKDKEKEKDKDKDKDKDSQGGEKSDERKYSTKLASSASRSSLKKALKRSNSKEQPPAETEHQEDGQDEIDPVYSLLKCAADLPRQGKHGYGHACCMQQKPPPDNLTVRSSSRSSSPLSVGRKGNEDQTSGRRITGCMPWSRQQQESNDSETESFVGQTPATTNTIVLPDVVTRDYDVTHRGRADTSKTYGSTADIILTSKGARSRRVKFRQGTRKSQSLDTPYHHTHQQHKLDVEMDRDHQDRSFSYTIIPQYNTEKGRLLQPPRLRTQRQRSFSMDDLSPASSDHEKWEKEARPDYRQKINLEVTDTSRGTLQQQRSLSWGDITPSMMGREKWERENVVDETKAQPKKSNKMQTDEQNSTLAEQGHKDRLQCFHRGQQKFYDSSGEEHFNPYTWSPLPSDGEQIFVSSNQYLTLPKSPRRNKKLRDMHQKSSSLESSLEDPPQQNYHRDPYPQTAKDKRTMFLQRGKSRSADLPSRMADSHSGLETPERVKRNRYNSTGDHKPRSPRHDSNKVAHSTHTRENLKVDRKRSSRESPGRARKNSAREIGFREETKAKESGESVSPRSCKKKRVKWLLQERKSYSWDVPPGNDSTDLPTDIVKWKPISDNSLERQSDRACHFETAGPFRHQTSLYCSTRSSVRDKRKWWLNQDRKSCSLDTPSSSSSKLGLDVSKKSPEISPSPDRRLEQTNTMNISPKTKSFPKHEKVDRPERDHIKQKKRSSGEEIKQTDVSHVDKIDSRIVFLSPEEGCKVIPVSERRRTLESEPIQADQRKEKSPKRERQDRETRLSGKPQAVSLTEKPTYSEKEGAVTYNRGQSEPVQRTQTRDKSPVRSVIQKQSERFSSSQMFETLVNKIPCFFGKFRPKSAKKITVVAATSKESRRSESGNRSANDKRHLESDSYNKKLALNSDNIPRPKNNETRDIKQKPPETLRSHETSSRPKNNETRDIKQKPPETLRSHETSSRESSKMSHRPKSPTPEQENQELRSSIRDDKIEYVCSKKSDSRSEKSHSYEMAHTTAQRHYAVQSNFSSEGDQSIDPHENFQCLSSSRDERPDYLNPQQIPKDGSKPNKSPLTAHERMRQFHEQRSYSYELPHNTYVEVQHKYASDKMSRRLLPPTPPKSQVQTLSPSPVEENSTPIARQQRSPSPPLSAGLMNQMINFLGRGDIDTDPVIGVRPRDESSKPRIERSKNMTREELYKETSLSRKCPGVLEIGGLYDRDTLLDQDRISAFSLLQQDKPVQEIWSSPRSVTKKVQPRSSRSLSPRSPNIPSDELQAKPDLGKKCEVSSAERSPGKKLELSSVDRSPGKKLEVSSADRSPGKKLEGSSADRSPGKKLEISSADRSPGKKLEISSADRSPGKKLEISSAERSPGSTKFSKTPQELKPKIETKKLEKRRSPREERLRQFKQQKSYSCELPDSNRDINIIFNQETKPIKMDAKERRKLVLQLGKSHSVDIPIVGSNLDPVVTQINIKTYSVPKEQTVVAHPSKENLAQTNKKKLLMLHHMKTVVNDVNGDKNGDEAERDGYHIIEESHLETAPAVPSSDRQLGQLPEEPLDHSVFPSHSTSENRESRLSDRGRGRTTDYYKHLSTGRKSPDKLPVVGMDHESSAKSYSKSPETLRVQPKRRSSSKSPDRSRDPEVQLPGKSPDRSRAYNTPQYLRLHSSAAPTQDQTTSSTCRTTPQSPPYKTRKKKLNLRMKSFSLDAPEPPMSPPTAFDESSKKKSSSITNTCFRSSPTGAGGGPPDTVQSPPYRTRRMKLNKRMKSFSLDTPDTGGRSAAALEEAYRKVSNPIVTPCLAAQSSPTHQRRSRFIWNKSCSFDVEDCLDFQPPTTQTGSPKSGNSQGDSLNNSRSNSPGRPRKKNITGNLYVVLYNLKGREKGDLDLRAGWKLSALDTNDPDWWKGKCNGKVGYFPSNYVIKINPGEKALQVVSSFEVRDGDSGIRLLKDQIVIGEVRDEKGMVTIRTADMNRFPCPVKYFNDV